MPCARAGLPSGPANQQPVSSIQITGAEVEARHAVFDPVGDPLRRRAPAPIGRARPSRIDREGSISLANSVALASASGGISVKTAPALSLQAMVSGCQVPDESRLPERGKDAGGLRDSGHQVASIRDTTG